ncbi:hypothetical protein NBRC116583_11400 [Arenicella sp. 4NH20-0111]|uniref:DUF1772 domain-containing protein n=1 Tax=Arenicella sp. 4NH20-0111 TaxID=3127648 RepID=UPI0031098AB1
MLETIPLLSTMALGLFTGSLLTEGMILVPYWKRMPASEFIKLHGTLGPQLFRYFAPLTTIAVVLAVTTAILDHGQRPELTAAAALCVLTLLIFFLYFRKTNASFKNGVIDEQALPSVLALWSKWHWIRTSVMLFAFGLSILGLQ